MSPIARTAPLALAAAWAAFVLALAHRLRPPPPRARRLVAAAQPPQRRAGRLPAAAAAATGRLLARAMRRNEPDPVAARRTGAAVLVALAVLPLLPAAAAPAAAVAWALPAVAVRRRERRRLDAVAGALPEAVDLLLLAVDAGCTVPLAVGAVARRGSGPLAEELRHVVAEVEVGRRVADALDDVPARAGEAVRPLVGALVAAERYGAPLRDSLERLAADVRLQRRRRAEEAARRVPVKLLFPLVFCTLPAFALLTVAPLVVSAARSLRL